MPFYLLFGKQFMEILFEVVIEFGMPLRVVVASLGLQGDSLSLKVVAKILAPSSRV